MTHGCPHPRSITQRPHKISPFTLPHRRLSGLLAWSRTPTMPRAVYLELGSLFKPTVALWKQAQTRRCSVKHSHSPSCSALYSTLSSETQCKQISWSTAKEWRIKAYLPVFSNYLLVPKLQSIRTLKTKLSYSLNGYNLLISLFLLHYPLYFKR